MLQPVSLGAHLARIMKKNLISGSKSEERSNNLQATMTLSNFAYLSHCKI